MLEKEDVVRLLLVHVPPEDAECVLVVAGIALGLRRRQATAGDRLLHEPGDVIVEEGKRLLRLRADRVRPGPAPGATDHDALDDEAVGRLDEQHLGHTALIEERADRAEDLLEVLARAALVDPHRVSSARRLRRRRVE